MVVLMEVMSNERKKHVAQKKYKFKCHMCKFGTNESLQELRNHLNEFHPTTKS